MTKQFDPYYQPVSVIHDAAKRSAALGKKSLALSRTEKIEITCGRQRHHRAIRGLLTETVLIIDNELAVRARCQDILIHLSILDMIMPEMGGNDMFRSPKTIDKDVTILFYFRRNLSNFSGINELLQNRAAGFFQ